jgi:VWFA-related protein
VKIGFRRVMLFSGLALFSAIATYSQQTSASAPEVISVRVNRVNVGVIVTGADGKFVEGLRREDFHLLDNGVEQPVSDFASVDEPADVLLLIEAGPAVYLLEGGHLHAAYALLAGLSAGDQVAVVKYAEGPEAICGFSADKQVAAGALDHLNFNLGFGALNLSESVATVLDWLDKTPGKKTIVLLSTGVDTSAPAASVELLQRLRVGDARVLAVSLAGEMRTPAASKKKSTPSKAALLTAQQFAEADEELRGLAVATGGRAYFPTNEKEFDAVYAEIAQIVRHEYSLGFSPAQLDGKVHGIEVRVAANAGDTRGVAAGSDTNGIGWRVDHRQGYLASQGQRP